MTLRAVSIAFPIIMVAIVAIDYALGSTAEYLNAYEIVRRTFALPTPEVSETYVLGQEAAGRWALAWAWLLWLVESAVATALVMGIIGGARCAIAKLLEV